MIKNNETQDIENNEEEADISLGMRALNYTK